MFAFKISSQPDTIADVIYLLLLYLNIIAEGGFPTGPSSIPPGDSKLN